jgi:ABC-type branched-subunit amino acid transport system permease subunit
MRGFVSRGGLWIGMLAAVALALPLVVSSAFAIDIFIRVLLFAFVGVAWNLMGGYAKQLSLGHAAYFGLGAYTSTILLIRYDVSPWIGMLAGGIVAMLASLPIGALCFRLRGPYFAIKRNIYLISAFLTALAGTFYVQYIYFIDPNTAFSFNVSVEAALVSIVGGIGTLWGPVIGTVLLEATSALLQSWLGGGHGGVQLTVYGLILIAVILYRPSGLMGVLSDAYERMAHGRGHAKAVPLDG